MAAKYKTILFLYEINWSFLIICDGAIDGTKYFNGSTKPNFSCDLFNGVTSYNFELSEFKIRITKCSLRRNTPSVIFYFSICKIFISSPILMCLQNILYHHFYDKIVLEDFYVPLILFHNFEIVYNCVIFP